MKYMKENYKNEEDISMLNTVIVVGRVTEVTDKDFKIAVLRSYKNSNGIYETDTFDCKMWKTEELHVNELVGVKGRLERREDKTIIIAEKVTLMSNRKGER